MGLFSPLLAVASGFMLLSLVFYTVFGQLTVRKLRKNPDTLHELGVEFTNGWDILNVAQALAIPRSWSKKLEKSPLSPLYANYEKLYNNTNRFDRALAAIFYWLFTASGTVMITLMILDSLGVFD